MKVIKSIPRNELTFTPIAEAVVKGFEDAIQGHDSGGAIIFIDCGNCDCLHVLHGVDRGEERTLTVNIPKDMWSRVRRRQRPANPVLELQ